MTIPIGSELGTTWTFEQYQENWPKCRNASGYDDNIHLNPRTVV